MSTEERLAGVQGYRVETCDGRIGSVAAVLPRVGRGNPGVLLVQSGLLTCRLNAIRFDEVESVDAGARRVVVRERREPDPEPRPTSAPRSGV
jgi:hypothetical protein